MSVKHITNYTSLLLILLYHSLHLPCISSESCQSGDENCEKYLTIYLQTKHTFPPSILRSDFSTFASSFHSMSNYVCEIEHMAYPILYFIRADTSTYTQYTYNNIQYDAYEFEFGINLLCPDTNTNITSCCNYLYTNFVREGSFGFMLQNWITHLNNNTIWRSISLEGSVVDYFWNYKLQHTAFPMPSMAPTLPPIADSINCEYTPNYLSIICNFQPSYTYANHSNALSIYERSTSLCERLFKDRNSLELLAIGCDNCKSATCQINNATYNENNEAIYIFNIEIFLTIDCMVSVNDELLFCMMLNGENCASETIGIIKASSYANIDALTDKSIAIISPLDVSSECMVYTIYDDIQSDIGVNNVLTVNWRSKYLDANLNPCFQNDCCTFSTIPMADKNEFDYQVSIVSVENTWGSNHSISKRIVYHDNLAFIPLVFHSTEFVSFKPLYFKTDIVLSCDLDIINLNINDWINNDEDEDVFAVKWKFQNVSPNIVQSRNRNIFLNPDILQETSMNQEQLTFLLTLNAQNFDILLANNVMTSITNGITMERKQGNIKAIISNGMHQYYPFELNNHITSISLIGNIYSFDQETYLSDPSDWEYTWKCSLFALNLPCPEHIESENSNPILEFNANVLKQDVIYIFTLQIVDPITQRTDEANTFITVTESVINMIINVNIEWDNTLYYLPSYHGYTNITAAIEEYIYNDNDQEILWVYTFCFEPELQNGVSCDTFESMDLTFTYNIEPFDTLPGHNYIVDVSISSSEYINRIKYNGMVSTVLDMSSISHIIEISVSSDYHRYNNSGYLLSSNIYKNLYKNTNLLIEFIDFNLLSMKTNCLYPPCSYSYFYEIKDNHVNIPFYFALGNGLSVSPLSGVILPWSYDTINILGCIEDTYGSTTCKLIEYIPSIQLITNDICDYFVDINTHLTLLSKVGDKLSLSQFMTTIMFQITDANTENNNNCIQSLIVTIFNYIHQDLITDEYFIYYPFHILQILYLASENNLITSNTYQHFVEIYDEISNTYSDSSHTYYFPYSDTQYMQWNVSFVLEILSDYHSIISLINGIDLQCTSPQSVAQHNIYNTIHDISNVMTDLLSTIDFDHPLQYKSNSLYVYARRFEYTLDTQTYKSFTLSEHFIDNKTNDHNILNILSISNSNIQSGTTVELKLLIFNPEYITEQCFDRNQAMRANKDSDDEDSITETKLFHISIENMDVYDTGQNRRRQLDANQLNQMTFTFYWTLSNVTARKLERADGFNINCEEFNIEDNSWSDQNCESAYDGGLYFNCECVTNGDEKIYRLLINMNYDSSFEIQEDEISEFKQELIVLDRAHWVLFLSLYLILMFGGYIVPLCRDSRWAPKCQRYSDYEKYFYASIVLGNFLLQIYLCCIGLVNDDIVWMWQLDVIFGLQCANLGVYNIFLLIVVYDKKCKHFKILKPFFISICNVILSALIVAFMIIHAILINNTDKFNNIDYASSRWSLWMVYIWLCGLCILFIIYLSYYCWKGKHFSGGKPFAYTEGKRESVAVWISIGGGILYIFCAINGYIIYALSQSNTNDNNDGYMLSFECLHWLSLVFLGIIITIIRKFEKTEMSHSIRSNVKNADHKHLPNTDNESYDNEYDDINDDGGTSSDGMIPVDGIMNNGQLSIDPNTIKSSNNATLLLGSSMDISNNAQINKSYKSSLIERNNSNQFGSMSADENSNDFMPQINNQQIIHPIDEDEKILINNDRSNQQIVMMAEDEEYDEYNALIHGHNNNTNQSIPGFIPNSHTRTMRSHIDTQTSKISSINTATQDALGNTMSYEPEMDYNNIDFLDIAHTNIEDEGIETPKSDGQLYANCNENYYNKNIRNRNNKNVKYVHMRTNSGGWKRNHSNSNMHYGYDRDNSSDQKVGQYSPYSEHGDTDPGYLFNNNNAKDHITDVGADKYAQNNGYYTQNNNINTVEIQSNPEIYNNNITQNIANIINNNKNDNTQTNEPTMNSISSIGIFDWNTPPPNNNVSQRIPIQNLNVNKWININDKSEQKRGLSISRRHTVNPLNFRNNNAKHSIRRVRSMRENNSDDDTTLHEENNNNNNNNNEYYNAQIPITPIDINMNEQHIHMQSNHNNHNHIISPQKSVYLNAQNNNNNNQELEMQNMPKLYGTGAGASVIMEPAHENENNSESSHTANHQYHHSMQTNSTIKQMGIDEEKHLFYENMYQQQNRISNHSRHTTATSFTGTFTQPDYPNIITVENDDQHNKILQTQNLMVIPFTKTSLDSHQKEIVNIFEEKTNDSKNKNNNNNNNYSNSSQH